MPIARNAPPDRPETQQMVVIHKAFRREFRLLPDEVKSVDNGDHRRAAFVDKHLELMLEFLHHHHHGEDLLLWPPLLERAPIAHDLVAEMEQQHQRVDNLIGVITALRASWTATAAHEARDAVAENLQELHAALEQHLDSEEADVLPLVEQYVTPAEWDAVAQDGQDNLPTNRLLALRQLGIILEDATHDERSWFLGEVALPARLVRRIAGARAYRKYTQVLRR